MEPVLPALLLRSLINNDTTVAHVQSAIIRIQSYHIARKHITHQDTEYRNKVLGAKYMSN